MPAAALPGGVEGSGFGEDMATHGALYRGYHGLLSARPHAWGLAAAAAVVIVC